MAYDKQTWANSPLTTSPISADRLNHMEDGIDGAHTAAAAKMAFKGDWNAATNSPALVDDTGATGAVYGVTVAGTHNFGAGGIEFFVGDLVYYTGTVWKRWGTGTPYAVTGMLDDTPFAWVFHVVTEDPAEELAGHVYFHLDV